MKLKSLLLAAGGACLLLAFQSLLSTRSHAAGPLDPPGGPAESMVSLQELSDQVENIQSRLDAQLPGGDTIALLIVDRGAAAWDDVANTWREKRLNGTITTPLTISNGNVLQISSLNLVSAWNARTRTWNDYNAANAINGASVKSSNGNFFFTTANNKVHAWNSTDGTWTSEVVSGNITASAFSEGKAIYLSDNNSSYIWTPEIGDWARHTWPTDIQVFGTDD